MVLSCLHLVVLVRAAFIHRPIEAVHDRQLLADSVEKVAPLADLRQNIFIGQRRACSMMGQLSSGQERLFYSLNLEDQ